VRRKDIEIMRCDAEPHPRSGDPSDRRGPSPSRAQGRDFRKRPRLGTPNSPVQS
jgi:hypothetical protein